MCKIYTGKNKKGDVQRCFLKVNVDALYVGHFYQVKVSQFGPWHVQVIHEAQTH